MQFALLNSSDRYEAEAIERFHQNKIKANYNQINEDNIGCFSYYKTKSVFVEITVSLSLTIQACMITISTLNIHEH